MNFTFNEIKIMANQYPSLSDFSCLKRIAAQYGAHSQEEGVDDEGVSGLEARGAFFEGQPVPGMKAVLDTLAFPERMARFTLKNDDIHMNKEVYCTGDQRILVEYLKEEVMISIYDTEAQSVRQEISNQTGVSFQKHSSLRVSFTEEALLAFAGLVDWLRRDTLLALAGQFDETPLSKDSLTQFIHKPLPKGLLMQIMGLTGLENPTEDQIEIGLTALSKLGLITETNQSAIAPSQEVIRFATQFTIPSTAISLELTEGHTYEEHISAREVIVMASSKDALSISIAQDGYHLEALAGTEILAQIDAYLKCPILSA